MVFKNVDFPQPEGPISAVMLFSGIFIPIFLRAWFLSYHKLRSETSIFSYYLSFLIFFSASFAAMFNTNVSKMSITAIAKAVSNSPRSFAYI